MAIQSEFLLAINQIAAERGVEVESILTAVEAAISAAYRKDHELSEEDLIECKIDRETGEISMSLNGKDVKSEGLGRVAAQTAKQVMAQKIREAEKEAMMVEFETKIGSIENANIQRMVGPDVIVEIGKITALLPSTEQIKGEWYKSGQKIKVFLLRIDEDLNGGNLIVSRNTPLMLQALFENEVPEISNGTVEIKSIAREAGSRSKVAVISNAEGVDPIGACVGQRGTRIEAIMNELKDEKVDIIEWKDNIADFIRNSLSPSKPVSVEIDEENHSAIVIVPDDQQSLAIGKEGQNVRLAAKLTGWDIDIKGESEESSVEVSEVKDDIFEGLDEKIVEKLKTNNINTKEDIEKVISGEIKIKGIGVSGIENIKKQFEN